MLLIVRRFSYWLKMFAGIFYFPRCDWSFVRDATIAVVPLRWWMIAAMRFLALVNLMIALHELGTWDCRFEDFVRCLLVCYHAFYQMKMLQRIFAMIELLMSRRWQRLRGWWRCYEICTVAGCALGSLSSLLIPLVATLMLCLDWFFGVNAK